MSRKSEHPGHAPGGVFPGFDDQFLAAYYEHAAAEDLQGYSPEDLERRARRHAELADSRPAGTAAVSILTESDASVLLVVADALPHLIHSLTAELGRRNESVRLLVHPGFLVRRDPRTDRLTEVRHSSPPSGLPGRGAGGPGTAASGTGQAPPGWFAETWVAAEIGRLPGSRAIAELIGTVRRILADVQLVSDDAPAIHSCLARAITSLDRLPAGTVPAPAQLAELLGWLDHGNFTFLGYSEYDYPTAEGPDVVTVRTGAGLGLLRDGRPEALQPVNGMPHEQALTLAISDLRSSVPRPAYLDEFLIRTFDGAGRATGEVRFVGLFTPGATGRSVRRIPVIRDKVRAILDHLGHSETSHPGRQLLSVLESFPLDELFHRDLDELSGLAREILLLQARHQTRVFLRSDSYGRFMTALVFLPRQRYSTAVRLRIENELKQAFGSASLEFEVRLGGSPMARVFFRILLPAGGMPDVDPAAVERSVISATRTWAQGLDEALRGRLPSAEARRLSALWSGAFPASYRADFDVEDAVEDIIRFEQFDLDGAGGRQLNDPQLAVQVRPVAAPAPARNPAEDARIRLYLTAAHSLTRILPFFHNLGLEVLNQRPFDLLRGSGRPLFLYDLGVRYPAGIDPALTSGLLGEAFAAAMRGDSESDRFDALVLREGIQWRQAAILRSYAKYLQQLGTTTSYGFMADTLLANVRATRALLALFRAKFDPGLTAPRRLGDTEAARKELLAAIEDIPVLDADRLLRTFMNLVESTLRTNYFQHRPHLSLKLNPAAIASAPFPRPKYEIWVYSPRVEGVHLRFGALARGGLRWSDRSEDFRTEVLGLVKAQNVKNSVIVPTGAKGGFYPKHLPDPAADRDAWLAESLECYRIFVRGLLDVTDNLVTTAHGETVVPPARVVRHDADDYYLVVAADKGTASFSDAANAVAAEYGFWLGDAFASGGTVGYDHKQMGITARGAWESVKHHFRELGVDCQEQDFTVAGVGDMSGDVFGNGMLLSRHTRLVAAFDHRHIFLDPAPDAAASFEERRRLFALPRSSWADYDPALISDGGGVHSRRTKSIRITDQVRDALALDPGTVSLPPHALLQAILRAPVDLLYNGGIGTYVKASTEDNAGVGDKANDPIRVNGNEVRAKIIAEGGNLGITQLGRIEAALGGVLLNTDAIDNSAGVDCSDHEVNIKIFVDRMIAAGKMRPAERTGFLHSLTDEVARLVLANNTDQNVLLFNDRHLVLDWSHGFERTIDWLENATDLDRRLEGLPSSKQLRERVRSGAGLTAPELAVLAAYAKIELAAELNASGLAEDPWFRRVLRGYFPHQLSARFEAELDTHPLRRQIVCTVMANDMINLGGITFAFRAIEETTATAAVVAKAFVVAREAYDLPWIVNRLAALPAGYPNEHIAEATLHMRRILDRATRWYVTHDHRDQPVDAALGRIMPTLDLLRTRTVDYLRGSDLDRVQERLVHWDAVGMPRELGMRASDMLESFGLLDISLISEQVREPVLTITDLYYAVFQRIGAANLLLSITDLPRQSRWEALARAALRDDVYSAVADMTVSVMETTRGQGADAGTSDAVERIVEWERGHQEQLGRIKDTFAEVTKPGQVDIASISVALKLLRTLVRR
ncbi:NAD-glutamate dehydrogenase [Arthrobacter sp. PM3]|uniref:NAD-glutamate dehydrogenase n=1 Tax=Arthrobacter sp. PM3 TaxID=2017685 RepID=UPI000E1043F4|nr:NAD-glutamate dehydrogenase [Arthrobacter sp. PM3]AXJ09240.1 glutamate dehydrogenase [Arthrobacter sp. PM3]